MPTVDRSTQLGFESADHHPARGKKLEPMEQEKANEHMKIFEDAKSKTLPMCKATVELNFDTAVTDVETSFEKLILDRTESDPLMPILHS
jgi:hypothetical protein